MSSNKASDLIADLVTKWEDSFEVGLNLSPREVCIEHPELEPVVQEQIRKLKRMRWLTSTWDSKESETLDNGSMIANRFRIEGVLGSGGLGLYTGRPIPSYYDSLQLKSPTPIATILMLC